jgi:hypothetical protein
LRLGFLLKRLPLLFVSRRGFEMAHLGRDRVALAEEVAFHYGSRPEIVADFGGVADWVGQSEALDLLDSLEFLYSGCAKLGQLFDTVRECANARAVFECQMALKVDRDMRRATDLMGG